MEPTVFVSLITGVLGCVAGVGGLFIAWRKLGAERHKLEAEARKTNSERRNIDVDSLCDTVVALDNEIKRLRTEMEQERQETSELIAALRQDLNAALSELAQAKEQIEADNTRIVQLQADNERLKQALDRSLDAARRFKADLDRALAELGRAQEQIRRLENGSNQCACVNSRDERAGS